MSISKLCRRHYTDELDRVLNKRVIIGHNVREKKSHKHPEESNYRFVTLNNLKVIGTNF